VFFLFTLRDLSQPESRPVPALPEPTRWSAIKHSAWAYLISQLLRIVVMKRLKEDQNPICYFFPFTSVVETLGIASNSGLTFPSVFRPHTWREKIAETTDF
jgi:hypothetical protein